MRPPLIGIGNHDITLHSDFYEQYGLYFHNQYPQNPEECRRLLKEYSSITYLQHEAVTVRLNKEDGPKTTFKVFGSPYSPAQGLWAFGYPQAEAQRLWESIPLDIDIVITHTPPKYHCDELSDRGSVGCEALRQTLWRVRPRVAVCGHVHEGRGVERIRWDLSATNVKYKEEYTGRWTDPGQGNNKQSLVDLSCHGGEPVENNGGDKDVVDLATPCFPPTNARHKSTFKSLFSCKASSGNTSEPEVFDGNNESTATTSDTVGTSPNQPPKYGSQPLPNTRPKSSSIPNTPINVSHRSSSSATHGQGGLPPSGRCDLEALSGRLGRKETCVINAAIMASHWPHKGIGGRKYNKAIVVDIDLPLWTASVAEKEEDGK